MKSMEENLCFVTWVYGKRYIGYLPLYLYSIHKNYPDCWVKIFLEKRLPEYIKVVLEEFNLLNNTEIIENFSQELVKVCKTGIERRCIRWLIGEEVLGHDFRYFYFGDVDIYIVDEKPGLDIQHIRHLKTEKKCYSNALRLSLKDYLLNSDRKRISEKHLFRLTGLHFVDSEEYFDLTRQAQDYIKEKLIANRRTILNFFLNDDERCLWLVVFLSKIGFPKGSYQLSSSTAFRPLHGIHFAIGREKEAYRDIFRRYPEIQEEHKEYYNMFKQQYNEDSKLRLIMNRLPYYTMNVIKNCCLIWGDVMNEDGIQSRE